MHGQDEGEDAAVLYRLTVDGRVAPGWRAWFGADGLQIDGPRTTLHVRVADQAELYARLRRIHDLNLTLISLDRVGGTGTDRGTP